MSHFLGIDECAAAAGVTRRSVERALQSKKLRAMRRAVVRVLVDEVDLREWMANRKNAVAEPREAGPVVAESIHSNEQPAAAPVGAQT